MDKLEPVCTVGQSVPVWDRSRTDPLSRAQGLKVLRELRKVDDLDRPQGDSSS